MTKQEIINELPANAVTVRQYADSTGYAVGYVYIKHNRAIENGKTPEYKIVAFQGVNFVIPH